MNKLLLICQILVIVSIMACGRYCRENQAGSGACEAIQAADSKRDADIDYRQFDTGLVK